jgi:hypothetical protein
MALYVWNLSVALTRAHLHINITCVIFFTRSVSMGQLTSAPIKGQARPLLVPETIHARHCRRCRPDRPPAPSLRWRAASGRPNPHRAHHEVARELLLLLPPLSPRRRRPESPDFGRPGLPLHQTPAKGFICEAFKSFQGPICDILSHVLKSFSVSL